MGVSVVTDSTSCLPADTAEREGLTVVPLHVLVSGRGRLSDREITPAEVAEILRRGKERVTTSRIAPGEFVDAWRAVTRRTGCEAIVSAHLSAGVSGTVEAAELARDELAGELRVEVVDSRVLGMALGYAACAGARAATAGAGVEQVADVVRTRAGETRTLFYVDTLEHLRRGGRIGRAAALLGSALAVKPLLTIRDGEVAPQEKVRTRAKALSRLVDLAVEAATAAGPAGAGAGALEGDVEQADVQAAAVEVTVHELAAREAAEELAGRLAERIGSTPDIVELDPVVGVHTGPGTLAVVVSPPL